MAAETIGEALSYGWRVTARCAAGKQDGMHRHKECVYRAELDMETLVWTRGRAFPLAWLQTRLRCPLCGSREVVLLVLTPKQGNGVAGRQKAVGPRDPACPYALF